MQINMGDIQQIQAEQEALYNLCIQHKECKNCPVKQNGSITTNFSVLSCENARKE